jgi:hypothetical protein
MLERRSDRPGIQLVDTAAEPRTTAGLIRVLDAYAVVY